MAPRRRSRGVVTAGEKENSTPPGGMSRGKGRTGVRRTRRVPSRFIAGESTNPCSSGKRGAAVFRPRPRVRLSLERRRESFEFRALNASSICTDDPAVDVEYLLSLKKAWEKHKDERHQEFDRVCPRDMLEPAFVCDDSLPDAVLLTHMRCALFHLRNLGNMSDLALKATFVDVSTGEGVNEARVAEEDGRTRMLASDVIGDGHSGNPEALSAEPGSYGVSSTTDMRSLRDLLLDLAASIAVERFIGHSSNSIRLMTACIVAELLRVTAPEPPLSLEKLVPVSALFVDQLALLKYVDDPLHPYRFALLEQLATVKTFVVFCDDENVIADLFACFYALLSAKHTQKLSSHLVDILRSVLEEADQLGQLVIEGILAPLAPSLAYSEEAASLAESVVNVSCNALQVPLCNFFNLLLRSRPSKSLPSGNSGSGRSSRARTFRTGDKSPGVEDDDDMNEFGLILPDGRIKEHSVSRSILKSALASDVEAIFIRVNRVVPDIFIYVIPNFERDLRANDAACRFRCVDLLASLFSSSVDMVRSYPSLLTDFVSRASDVDVSIRALLCPAISKLMDLHEELRSDLETRLRERLLDTEERVRVSAVDAVMSGFPAMSEGTLREVAGRVKDRKTSVRQAAVRCLVRVYSLYADSRCHGGFEDARTLRSSNPSRPHGSGDCKGSPPTSAASPLDRSGSARCHVDTSWIPAYLVRTFSVVYNIKDHATSDMIESALFHDLHHNRHSLGTHSCPVTSLCHMLGSLDAVALRSFRSIVVRRSRLRAAVQQVINCRVGSRNRPRDTARTTDTGEGDDHDLVSHGGVLTNIIRTQSVSTQVGAARAFSEEGVVSKELVEQLRANIFDGRVTGLKKSVILESFVAVVDLNFFRKLGAALDERSPDDVAKAALDDAVSRVGSQSPLAEFVRTGIVEKCAPGLMSSAHVNKVLEHVQNPAVEAMFSPGIPDSSDTCRSRVPGLAQYLECATVSFPGVLNIDNCRLISGILLEASRSLQLSAEKIVDESPAVRPSCWNDNEGCLVPCLLKIICQAPETAFSDRAKDLADACMSLTLSQQLDPRLLCEQAKWASRTYITIARNSHDPSMLCTFAKSLSERLDKFNGNVVDILGPLTGLCQVATRAPKAFEDVSLGSFDFSRALLMESFNSKIHGRIAGIVETHASRITSRPEATSSFSHDGMDDHAGFSVSCLDELNVLLSCLSETVKRATKLLVTAVSLLESRDEELDAVLDCLVGVALSKGGDVFCVGKGRESGLLSNLGTSRSLSDSIADMFGQCRLSTSVGVLRVASQPGLFRQVQPSQFLAVCLCAQDEHPDVRIAFARKVAKFVVKRRLPFRWVASLSLMGIDPDEDNVREVRRLLSSLVLYRRRAVASVRHRSPDRSQALLELSPESCLPELVWLVANHPDVEADEGHGFADSERYLDFFFDKLLESHEYASILNMYLVKLSMAADAHPDGSGSDNSVHVCSSRLSAVARIASALLEKKRAGKKWTMVEYSGEARLPTDLFALKSQQRAADSRRESSMLQVAKAYDEDSAHAGVAPGARTQSSKGTVDSPRAHTFQGINPDIVANQRGQKAAQATAGRRINRTETQKPRKGLGTIKHESRMRAPHADDITRATPSQVRQPAEHAVPDWFDDGGSEFQKMRADDSVPVASGALEVSANDSESRARPKRPVPPAVADRDKTSTPSGLRRSKRRRN